MNKFSMEEVRLFWNSVAGKYDSENAKFGKAHTQRFTEAMKHMDISKGESLLNVWSRTGEAIPYLRKKYGNIRLENYELSDKFAGIARKRFPKESIRHGSLHNLPYEASSFDYVMSLETLEHVPDPMKFLAEVRRVLKPGGRLVMSLPPASAEYTSVIADLLRIGHGEGPHKFLSSWAVKRMLKKTGLRLLVHKGTVLVPVGPKFMKRFGYWLEPRIQGTILSELGIRQFYICKNGSKKSN